MFLKLRIKIKDIVIYYKNLIKYNNIQIIFKIKKKYNIIQFYIFDLLILYVTHKIYVKKCNL